MTVAYGIALQDEDIFVREAAVDGVAELAPHAEPLPDSSEVDTLSCQFELPQHLPPQDACEHQVP